MPSTARGLCYIGIIRCFAVLGMTSWRHGGNPAKEIRVAVLVHNQAAGEQIMNEIIARLDLLLDIGLDYMSLNRKAATLSGGESQRIRQCQDDPYPAAPAGYWQYCDCG